MRAAAAIVQGNFRLPQREVTMDPRYPIGAFKMPAQVTPARRQEAIEEIAATPGKLRAAVKGLSDSQLDTPYREGRALRSGQPPQCLRSLEAGAHREQADNQAVQRSGVGRASRRKIGAHRGFADAGGFGTHPLGPTVAFIEARTFRQSSHSPGTWRAHR